MQPFHKTIITLINNQKRTQARKKLQAYLETQPRDAEAWYLRSLVEDDHAEQIRALHMALAHDPQHRKAQQRFAKLNQPARQSSRRRWLLIGGFSVGIAILWAVGIVLFLQRGNSTSIIPTLAAFNTEAPAATSLPASITPTDVQPIEAVAEVQTTSVAATHTLTNPTATLEDTVQSAQDTSSTATETVTQPTTQATIQVVNTVVVVPTITPLQPLPTATVAPQETNNDENPPNEPDEPNQGGRVVPPDDDSRTASTPVGLRPTPTPQPTLGPGEIIPVGVAMQIGTGEMRVLSSAIPGNELITTLGGTVPPAPPNQGWVVVEVLIVCNPGTNCSPNINDFQLWSDDTPYPPVPLNIESGLGDGIITSGQVWGHIAFLVPNNDPPRLLRLQRNGSDFRFALQ